MYKNNFVAVIKHKGRILREIDGEISLPFGSQYSILLKNENSKRALVTIEVDGKNILGGKSLILNKNSSQEIKGFMRDMLTTNRFKFIHKTKEISDYRGDRVDDGLIRISYKFEKRKVQPVAVIDSQPDWPASDSIPYPNKPWDIKYCMSCSGPVGDTYGNCNTVSANFSKSKCNVCVNSKISNYSEDGITVKGSKITQPYQYGNIGNLETNSYVIVLQLKGQTKHKRKVIKPITVKTKLRCSTCGRRSKSNSKFCYNCGTYLEAS